MELVSISKEYVCKFECNRCESRKTKQLDGDALKHSFSSTYATCDDIFNLMLREGVYPYKYIDPWEKFEKTRLPPQKAFYSYSKLNIVNISDKVYKHAQQVPNIMEENMLGCYHDTYLKTDVLLLADVFERFRETCMENYKLDPAHFYTAPKLAWH